MDLNNTSAVVTGGASGLGEATALAAGRARRQGRRRRPQRRPRRASPPRSAAPTPLRRHQHRPGDRRGRGRGRPRAAAQRGELRGHRLGDAHHRQGRRVRVGARPRRLPQGHRDQPHRHVQRLPARRDRDEPQRRPTPTASAARSSTPPRSPPRTARSARSPTPRPRAASSGSPCPLARDLAVVGVRVNCILPGLIDTPIYGEGAASEEFKSRLGAGVLFPKRLGFADEFASLAVELLSNSYMNAESVRIDAGIRMQPK